uniref:Uncharacterized protein n=1 Tax=Oncorhynchus kisutch TaxID=8019 RepID=A0A8C7J0S3_ONCKI
ITFWLTTFFISISSIFQVHSTSQCIDTLRSNNINSTSVCPIFAHSSLHLLGTLLTTAELDKCGKTLQSRAVNVVKRYSGFIENKLTKTNDERGDVDSENELGVYNDDSAINKVKQYRGFLCTFGPKTMRREQGSREELQKRYGEGGFLRRSFR